MQYEQEVLICVYSCWLHLTQFEINETQLNINTLMLKMNFSFLK